MSGVALLAQAYRFAAERHHGQERKGQPGEPYIYHLIEVAGLVAEHGGGGDPALVTAAVLHDVLEDTATSRAELAARFGGDVALLVEACTDDQSLAQAERRRRQVVHAPGLPPRAKRIKLADKVSNLRALVTRPADAWPANRRSDYVRWAEQVAAGLRGVEPALEQLFDEAAGAAMRHFEGLT